MSEDRESMARRYAREYEKDDQGYAMAQNAMSIKPVGLTPLQLEMHVCEKMTDEQIAEKFGTTVLTVSELRRRWPVSYRGATRR